MSQNRRVDELKELINSGQTEKALELAKSPVDDHEAEMFVRAALREEGASDLLDMALEAFLNSRENRSREHANWVHSLSHFSGELWKLRKLEWIKKLNEVAFRGVNELGNDLNSNRLVEDFRDHALWSDDPAEFHLSLKNLSWMKWEYCQRIRPWIENGKFESEEAFLRWKLSVEKLVD